MIRRQPANGVSLTPDLIAGLGSGTAPGGSFPGVVLPPGGLVMGGGATRFLSNPRVREALVQSLASSIGSDHRMWTWDTTYQVSRKSSSVCLPRGQRGRPWEPGGPCALDRQDCAWSTYILNVQCGARTFNEVMFQYPRWTWGQTKLRDLLAAPPGSYPTKATARRWAEWCWEVMSVVSVMYWSTNIRDAYAGKVGFGAGTGPATWDSTPFLDRSSGPATIQFLNRLDNARHRLGGYGTAAPVFPLELRNWNDVANASGWGRNRDGRVVMDSARVPRSKSDFAPHVLTHWTSKWPVGWRNPIGSRPNSLGVNQPVYTASRPTNDFDALVRLFENSGERELLVPVSWAGDPRRNASVPGSYVSAEGTYLYCRALAEDLSSRSYASMVATGLQRWRDAIMRLPFDYRQDLYGGLADAAAFGNMMSEAKADEVFGGIQAGMSSLGAVLSAIPGAQIGAAVVAVVQALLAALNEIFKATDSYATGGAAIPPCPPLPVIRVIEGGQVCQWDMDPSASGTLPGAPHRRFTLRTDTPLFLPPSGESSGGRGIAIAGVGILAALLALRSAGK